MDINSQLPLPGGTPAPPQTNKSTNPVESVRGEPTVNVCTDTSLRDQTRKKLSAYRVRKLTPSQSEVSATTRNIRDKNPLPEALAEGYESDSSSSSTSSSSSSSSSSDDEQTYENLKDLPLR